MRRFFVILSIFCLILVFSSCTSLHMVLDGLDHAEIQVTNDLPSED